MKIIQMRK